MKPEMPRELATHRSGGPLSRRGMAQSIAVCALLFLLLPLAAPTALNAVIFVSALGLALAELATLSPQELFKRCAQIRNNQAAWQEFDRRYEKEVYTGICSVIGFPPCRQFQELFEDLKQNFYVRLLENDRRALLRLRGNSEGEARRYVRMIAASAALNLVRRKRLTVPMPEKQFPEPGTNDPEIDKTLVRQSVEAILQDRLHGRNKYRKIIAFKMHYYDGCKAGEIARVAGLGLTERAAENLLSRMRKMLREFWQTD